MKIVSARRPGSKVIGRVQGISRLAKARLKWLDHCRGHGENAALTCRYFGISRQTFYRWKRRYNPRDLTSLEERSHRPRRLRQPTWSRELALVEVRTRATANTATDFLSTLQARMPFPVRAIQVDGGSEFQAGFEQACQERGLRLFILPPRSPKLNGAVERAQRTHTEEFYEVNDFPLETAPLNQQLRLWELTYNTVRPRQALGYLTPQQFLRQQQSQRKKPECH